MRLSPPSRVLARLAACLGLLSVCVLSLSQTVDGKPDVKAEIIEKVTKTIGDHAFVPGVDFGKLQDFLAQEKTKLDDANSDDDFAKAMNEALAKFGASHTVLWTPRVSEARISGSTVGIGIGTRVIPEGLMITRVVGGTPASDAGLAPGDMVTAVGGEKVDGIKGITGPEGSEVKLTIKKQDGRVLDLSLTRRRYSTVRPPEFEWLDRDTAKLSIYTFDNTYDEGAIDTFLTKADAAKNLIVDLRDNGGGVVHNLQHFLSYLVPSSKAVGTYISRHGLDLYIQRTHKDPKDLAAVANATQNKLYPSENRGRVFKGHVIVLINGGSGSASEIAAAGLRDTIGATVIGAKSAGAVLISMLSPAADGFMIQYPLMDYITIKGQRLEGSGVAPDFETKDALYRLPNAPDPSVEKALAYIDETRHSASHG
jgi:carboxyl-terminal processing protease